MITAEQFFRPLIYLKRVTEIRFKLYAFVALPNTYTIVGTQVKDGSDPAYPNNKNYVISVQMKSSLNNGDLSSEPNLEHVEIADSNEMNWRSIEFDASPGVDPYMAKLIASVEDITAGTATIKGKSQIFFTDADDTDIPT